MKRIVKDIYLAAYLRLHKAEPELRIKGDRVVFVFDAEATEDLSEKFEWGEDTLCVSDYSIKIKETKTLMHKKKDEEKDLTFK